MYFRIVTLSGMMLMASTSLRSASGNDPRALLSSPTGRAISLDKRQSIVQYATKFVGTPYHYGGTSSKGFDCSGFTSFVLNNFGMAVPRTSSGQSVLGHAITFDDAKPGDLLFFGRGRHIEHVALVVDNDKKGLQMVHSSSSHGVMIEDMRQSSYWKKRIMFAVDLASL